MTQQWPPADPTADDHRRSPTHRMICFQQVDPSSAASPIASWCGLYPLSAGPFAEPEVLVKLDADQTRLLDVDIGAAVAATKRPDLRWEVRPPTGPDCMLTSSYAIRLGPGFAEAKGLAPLIVPRPGRTVSPYAKAAAGSKWVPSPSLESVSRWRRRRRRTVAADAFVATLTAGFAVVTGLSGNPAAILFGGASAYMGAGIAWRFWRDRVVTTGEVLDGLMDSTGSDAPLGVTLRTLVHLDWRPSRDWGSMAWVVIADDEHGWLEAPVAGVTGDVFDNFPAVAAVDGTFGSGKPVRLTLDDGTVLYTVRPLRQST